MNDLISVIIPAYNAERTIERCINSIRNQTYSNLEIIVVNDGSTDNTLKILNEISKIDNRVKVVDIPNGGVSHARNTGIDNAIGDYITFVDSDDTIEPTMYEYLLSMMGKYDVKIAHCSYSNYSDDGVISYVGNEGKVVVQSHDEALECLLTGRYFAGGLWNKLFATELFSDVRLDESIKITEDVLANYFLFDKVERSVYTDLCLYNYYQYNNSSTSTTPTIRKCIESGYVYQIMYDCSKGKSYERAALNRLAKNELMLLKASYHSDKKDRTKIKNNVKKYIELNCYESKKQYISALLLLYCPLLHRFIYYFYERIIPANYDPEQ